MESLSLPIIDISGLNSDDFASIHLVDQQISKACEEWGFFYAINHGVDPKLIQRATDLGLEFFHLSKDFKNTVARTEVKVFFISKSKVSVKVQTHFLIVEFPRLFGQRAD